jgi:SAM-dependent methyltransferase
MSIWDAKDKTVQREIYKNFSNLYSSKKNTKFLDIGVALYNDVTRDFFDKSINFYQLEPKKHSSCYNNDGFIEAKVECLHEKSFYESYKNQFDVIFDFGVFGWNGVELGQTERLNYVKNIHYMLKGDGVYVLHNDRVPRSDKFKLNIQNNVDKYFELTNILNYDKHIVLKNNSTTWDIRFFRKLNDA